MMLTLLVPVNIHGRAANEVSLPDLVERLDERLMRKRLLSVRQSLLFLALEPHSMRIVRQTKLFISKTSLVVRFSSLVCLHPRIHRQIVNLG